MSTQVVIGLFSDQSYADYPSLFVSLVLLTCLRMLLEKAVTITIDWLSDIDTRWNNNVSKMPCDPFSFYCWLVWAHGNS